jgi:hypothetical protein
MAIHLVVCDHRMIIVDDRAMFVSTLEIAYDREPGRPWRHTHTLVHGWDRWGDPRSVMFPTDDRRAPDWIIQLRLDHYPHRRKR